MSRYFDVVYFFNLFFSVFIYFFIILSRSHAQIVCFISSFLSQHILVNFILLCCYCMPVVSLQATSIANKIDSSIYLDILKAHWLSLAMLRPNSKKKLSVNLSCGFKIIKIRCYWSEYNTNEGCHYNTLKWWKCF